MDEQDQREAQGGGVHHRGVPEEQAHHAQCGMEQQGMATSQFRPGAPGRRGGSGPPACVPQAVHPGPQK